MFEENKITNLFGIKYPIIQGGMAGISKAELVSAVSEADGLGTIGAGLMPAPWVEQEIKKTKENTSNPFAINLFLQNPKIKDIVKVVLKQKVPIVFTGGGNPLPLFPYLQKKGIKVVPVVPSPRLAKKMEDSGADAVVVEGMEGGGHIGENTTFDLIPQTKHLLEKIPLIGAGGIYDELTARAAFLLGADGIQLGTRFLASEECPVSESYKEKVVNSSAEDIDVVLRFTGHPIRVVKNKLSEKWKKMEEKGAFPEEVRAEKIAGSAGGGDSEDTPLLAGFSAAGISQIKSCREIIQEIVQGME